MIPPHPATTPQQLGDYICDANPYTRKEEANDQFPTAMNASLEETEKAYTWVEWKFKTGMQGVGLALRIPYYFTDKDGQTVKNYLLIGFEGSGGE